MKSKKILRLICSGVFFFLVFILISLLMAMGVFILTGGFPFLGAVAGGLIGTLLISVSFSFIIILLPIIQVLKMKGEEQDNLIQVLKMKGEEQGKQIASQKSELNSLKGVVDDHRKFVSSGFGKIGGFFYDLTRNKFIKNPSNLTKMHDQVVKWQVNVVAENGNGIKDLDADEKASKAKGGDHPSRGV